MPGYWCLRVETIPRGSQDMGQVELDTDEREGGRMGPRELDAGEKITDDRLDRHPQEHSDLQTGLKRKVDILKQNLSYFCNLLVVWAY